MCNEFGCELNLNRGQLIERIYNQSGGIFSARNPYRVVEFDHDGEWVLITRGFMMRSHIIHRHVPCDEVWEWLTETGEHIETVQLFATYGSTTPEQYEQAKRLTEELVARGERHESDFNLFRSPAA